MTGNQKQLKEVAARAKAFETEREPERLREAFLALDDVVLAQEADPEERALLRAAVLGWWLQLLQTLDEHLDPAFDPKDKPQVLVEPPPTSSGAVLRPGADPALIDDPAARAAYEKAIAENRKKAERYRMNVHLGRLNQQVTPRSEVFIRSAYTKSVADQAEVRAAVEKTIENPARKAALLAVLASPKP